MESETCKVPPRAVRDMNGPPGVGVVASDMDRGGDDDDNDRDGDGKECRAMCVFVSILCVLIQ